jgi:superfamily II DNA or RNA helicase
MGTISRSGYITPNDTPEMRRELTVRPIVNGDFGFPPPPFKVFRPSKNGLCVPRFYGVEKFGAPTTDTRPEPSKINISFRGVLRDETSQNEAFSKAVSTGHGVLSLPCGYGKTTVALAVACALGYRTMIIVHKEFLANQWRERIQHFCPGATIGVVQQDRIEVENDFIIAMLQSLSSKEYSFDQFQSVGTMFVDEAHHICARVFSQSLFRMCPKHVYGLSATPDRKDGLTKVLHWFMGPTFFSIERKDQAQVEVFPIQFDCLLFRSPPPANKCGKLSLVHMITMLVEHEERNGLIRKTMKKIISGTSRQLLVLTDRREHCKYIASWFPDMSGMYMGGMKESDLLESSKKRIIVGTFSQAHEGLDIPTLDTVLLATPKSDIKQSIGRIMRETSGKKNTPHIYDMCDHWSVLFAMFSKRKRVYKDGGFNIRGDFEEPVEENPFKGKCIL